MAMQKSFKIIGYSQKEQKFLSEYSCGNIGAVMEIVFRSTGSNDRTLEREVHFRPDRSDLRTGKHEVEASKDEISSRQLPRTLKRRSLLLNNMTSEERFV
jgi:hypothetical protein